MKETLQRSEDAAYWMRQKAGDVVVATKLDEPLKKLDAVAAQSIGKVEETSIRVRPFQTNFYFFSLTVIIANCLQCPISFSSANNFRFVSNRK